jgi:hypothetical protein
MTLPPLCISLLGIGSPARPVGVAYPGAVLGGVSVSLSWSPYT